MDFFNELLSDLNLPTSLGQHEFPTSPRNANGNRISQTLFKNDLVFSLDANNGIMAFRIVSPPLPRTIELTGFTRLGNGAFQFAYSNAGVQSFRVFASTNLVSWNALGAATQSAPGWFQFTDATATNLPHRFYQLRAP